MPLNRRRLYLQVHYHRRIHRIVVKSEAASVDDLRWTQREFAVVLVNVAGHHQVWFDLASLPVYAPSEDYRYPTAQDYVRRAVDLVGADRTTRGGGVRKL